MHELLAATFSLSGSASAVNHAAGKKDSGNVPNLPSKILGRSFLSRQLFHELALSTELTIGFEGARRVNIGGPSIKCNCRS